MLIVCQIFFPLLFVVSFHVGILWILPSIDSLNKSVRDYFGSVSGGNQVWETQWMCTLNTLTWYLFMCRHFNSALHNCDDQRENLLNERKTEEKKVIISERKTGCGMNPLNHYQNHITRNFGLAFRFSRRLVKWEKREKRTHACGILHSSNYKFL